MAFPTRAPSRALLSSLTKSCSLTSPSVRATAVRQLRFASTERKPSDEGRSFKGQLYNSTAERLAKERAEQQRFAKERNEGAGGRNAALTFSMIPCYFSLKFDSNFYTPQRSSQPLSYPTTSEPNLTSRPPHPPLRLSPAQSLSNTTSPVQTWKQHGQILSR